MPLMQRLLRDGLLVSSTDGMGLSAYGRLNRAGGTTPLRLIFGQSGDRPPGW